MSLEKIREAFELIDYLLVKLIILFLALIGGYVIVMSHLASAGLTEDKHNKPAQIQPAPSPTSTSSVPPKKQPKKGQSEARPQIQE